LKNNVVSDKGSNLQLLSAERRPRAESPASASKGGGKGPVPFSVDSQMLPAPPNWQMMRSEARSLYARFIIRWSQKKLADHGLQEAA
jgi:hypothetical protein